MPSASFQNLPAVLCTALSGAKRSIRIAVCWFTHRDIFAVLLAKLREGISVELVLEYDSQNISERGLDFQRFIKLGGSLYAYRDTALMHHKFALLDDRLLLNGSFNWTYNNNAENLLALDDPGLVSAFLSEFNRLKALSVPVRKIRPTEVKVFAGYPLFRQTHFQLSDLRRRISGGAGVWWLRAGRKREPWAACFHEQRISVDPGGLLQRYWQAYRVWDTGLLDQEWSTLSAGARPALVRALRTLARRVRTRDVVLAVLGKQELLGLGIVQSEPRPETGSGATGTYREVQWLAAFPDAPLLLDKPLSPGYAGKFRGSALQVVHRCFTHQPIVL